MQKKKLEAFFSIFNSINENFRKVYRRLSNGGNGKLVLDNKKDPFAGGLKIVAQPPEKKPQPINSLSGGEKSVAALALIFAIQKISFSPFYVLDEVDMFLDSLNAEIVGKMIKENAMNTQTVVISLRKATLKNADVVFGVTSVEGISQIVGKINVQEAVEVINA
jgi:condensin subunit Smc